MFYIVVYSLTPCKILSLLEIIFLGYFLEKNAERYIINKIQKWCDVFILLVWSSVDLSRSCTAYSQDFTVN